MKGTTKTRTQRRMEKRQAIILLVLVLVVSLASFTLGVIVGRRGAERELAYAKTQQDKVLVTQAPPVVPSSTPEAAAPADPVADKIAGVATETVTEQEPKLSFYDDLSKDSAPLGSGINMAPVEEPAAAGSTQPPIDLPAQPIVEKAPRQETVAVVKQPAPVVPAATSSSVAGHGSETLPKRVAGGSHAVQIGSFSAAKDAIALKDKLLKEGYPAFMVEADLGAKGLWYRVRVGPYADAEQAKVAQRVLEKKEKIKGFVSHQ